jgi:hypothetical protein
MALSNEEALDTVIGQLADAFFWLSEGDELEGDERESVAMGSVDLAAIFSEGTKIEIVSVKDDEITMTMRIVDVLDYLNKTIKV